MRVKEFLFGELISDIYKCYPPSTGCVDLDTY